LRAKPALCLRAFAVPLFIKNGDKIRVKTDTREHQGKEH
jgi:hypothetical protein